MKSWLSFKGKRPLPRAGKLSIGNPSFWLEEIALPLGAVGVEAVPIGALLILGAAWQTNDPTQALLPVWALLVIELGVFWLERWLLRRSWPRLPLQVVLGSGWLVTLCLAWYFRFYSASGPLWSLRWLRASLDALALDSNTPFVLIVLALLLALLWWRGMTLARSPIAFDLISRRFTLGFVLLVVPLFFIGTVFPAARGTFTLQLGLLLPLFLFLGLSALSLARLAEVRRARRARGDQQESQRRWMLALLALSGGLVVLVLAVEQIFSYQTWLAFIALFNPAWAALQTLFGWLVEGFAWLLFLVLNPLVNWLASLFSGQANQNQPQPPFGGKRPPPPPGGKNVVVPTDWLAVARIGLIVLAVALLLFFLLRTVKRASLRTAHDAEEERENLDALGMLGAQLRGLLAGLAARFRRQGAQGAGSSDGLSAASVRALYRRVLARVAALGLGRRAQETPQELAERLVVALPSSEAVVLTDLAALTTAYEQARYGEQEPPSERLTTLQESTDRLLSHLNEQSQQETIRR